jgi:hypothetical protein
VSGGFSPTAVAAEQAETKAASRRVVIVSVAAAGVDEADDCEVQAGSNSVMQLADCGPFQKRLETVAAVVS